MGSLSGSTSVTPAASSTAAGSSPASVTRLTSTVAWLRNQRRRNWAATALTSPRSSLEWLRRCSWASRLPRYSALLSSSHAKAEIYKSASGAKAFWPGWSPTLSLGEGRGREFESRSGLSRNRPMGGFCVFGAVESTLPPMFGREPKQPDETRIVGDAGGEGDGAGVELFDIRLNSAGDTPWAVVDAISTGSVPTRSFVNTKQAKALVDKAPTTVAERVDSLQVQRLKVAFEAAGADFQVVPHRASS